MTEEYSSKDLDHLAAIPREKFFSQDTQFNESLKKPRHKNRPQTLMQESAPGILLILSNDRQIR